jgi:hypothetical protein
MPPKEKLFPERAEEPAAGAEGAPKLISMVAVFAPGFVLVDLKLRRILYWYACIMMIV